MIVDKQYEEIILKFHNSIQEIKKMSLFNRIFNFKKKVDDIVPDIYYRYNTIMDERIMKNCRCKSVELVLNDNKGEKNELIQ